MREDFEDIAQRLPLVKTPGTLIPGVLSRIGIERRRRARNRLATGIAMLVVAIISFIPSVQYLRHELARGGFSHYFSLLFSNSGEMAAYWKDFGFLLLESLPVIGITMVLATVLLFIVAIRRMASYKNNSLYRTNLWI